MLAVLARSPGAAAQCRIQRYPAIPITMKGLRPMVWTKINGVNARFFIDSGAFWSMLSPAARAEFNLPERMAPMGFWLQGINGLTGVDIATADTFTFVNVRFRHVEFLVGGNDLPSGAVGTLGGNLLRFADVEYDFGDGLMRFVKTQHCGGLPLAYWAGHQPVGVVDLQSTSARSPFLIGHASVNGKDIGVLFDSGTPRSMLTLDAARRAGITPESPGVKPAGRIFGIGRKWSNSWVAPVALFEIGGEKIEHTQLLIGDIHLPQSGVDMLLGADFFLSHHIFVANSQHKLYFTYNGGPVFDLGHRYWIKRVGAAPTLAGQGSGSGQAAGSAIGADGLVGQGMAYAAEGQYAPALAALSRACQLDPKNPQYLLQRGRVYRADKQLARALEDFNTAIALQPNLYPAHLARASLLVAWKDAPTDSASHAEADANIVDLLAPDDAELRLPLAQLYGRLGDYAAAVREIDQWIYYHGGDVLLPVAWNARCWIRAEANVDLQKALKDCNRALDRVPNSAGILDSRGLVYLRLGQLARSIEDYDAALKINSGIATSLYGRGLAELREGKDSLGRADLAAAARLNSGVSKRFARMGLTP